MKPRLVTFRNWMAGLFVTAAVTTSVIVAAPTPAMACGGFFCSNVPIEQSGEEILFTVEENNITAYIKISYQGEAKDFAWVVPVASLPEISVGSDSVFTRLGQVTQPVFNLNWDYGDGMCGFWAMDAAAGAGGGPESNEGESYVNVLGQAQVGPYDYAILESNDAQALKAWLDENDFDQPDDAIPLIEHYLENDMLFVALKLQQDKGTGDIRPLVLQFKENSPCVPLILTRIAAQPDMPVRVYVLGEHRAVPSNWFHVELNLQKIDWLNYGSNYTQVVTQAVDEAAGHGFVTEFAGSSANMKNQLWQEGQFNFSSLNGMTDAGKFWAQMRDMLMGTSLAGSPDILELLRKFIPLPQSLAAQGVTEQQFYNSPESYEAEYSKIPFSSDAFLAAVDETILDPLKAAQGWFDTFPYLTRMFTTVSPEEMTRDPLFAFHDELGDVPNVRTAEAVAQCAEDGTMTVTITLPDGTSYSVDWQGWGPVDNGPTVDESVPAAGAIELYGNDGLPRAVPHDFTQYVDQQLAVEVPVEEIDIPAVPNNGNNNGNPIAGGAETEPKKSSGCSVGSNSTSGGLWLVLMFVLGVLAVRRRNTI